MGAIINASKGVFSHSRKPEHKFSLSLITDLFCINCAFPKKNLSVAFVGINPWEEKCTLTKCSPFSTRDINSAFLLKTSQYDFYKRILDVFLLPHQTKKY